MANASKIPRLLSPSCIVSESIVHTQTSPKNPYHDKLNNIVFDFPFSFDFKISTITDFVAQIRGRYIKLLRLANAFTA
ncbi:MAG: hypothetical protein LE178_04290 [Endomicrobium sp.]|nr:hypothetical protein [Endomicrobium sp.]